MKQAKKQVLTPELLKKVAGGVGSGGGDDDTNPSHQSENTVG